MLAKEDKLLREKLRLKRLIKELSRKTGRGTELISLYVPPGRRISDVMSYLRQEYSTSANIKSDLTRKNVQNAIVKVMERLKLFKETPRTGLAIFCGAIPQNGPGTEKMEIYVVVPPEPMNISLYRCNSRFHLEPLKEMLREKDLYGLIAIDVEEAAIGLLEGSRIRIVSKHTSGIPGKHRAGGQSARRFERLREVEVNEYFKRVAKYVNETFLSQEYFEKLKGIIIGGPGFTKKEFYDTKHLDYRLKGKVIGFIDTNYSGVEGVREMVEKSKRLLRETRYMVEKREVDEFIKRVSSRDELVAYGLYSVWNAIKARNIEKILILDEFEAYVIKKECKACKFVEEQVMTKKSDLIEEKCSNCMKGELNVEVIELIDYLEENSREYGFNIQLISSKTEYGRIFKQFGGIAAIIRYKQF